ncbi:hypothetical protein DPEC_G00197780 [Dallia pectoralis]|uniref:Uncharacterized protein n=1 Tax=Dallia pectoralis TaxID=75939 RepID=A0ACC2G7Z5_DALPE|nr:hypothetical protein DPEC_G00197780 [Dallia pectoralis]
MLLMQDLSRHVVRRYAAPLETLRPRITNRLGFIHRRCNRHSAVYRQANTAPAYTDRNKSPTRRTFSVGVQFDVTTAITSGKSEEMSPNERCPLYNQSMVCVQWATSAADKTQTSRRTSTDGTEVR